MRRASLKGSAIGISSVALLTIGILAVTWNSEGERVSRLQEGSEGISYLTVDDNDYKRDVQRGVLEKHAGFPDLPQCPTEGLWGTYRAGYAPGQAGGNCQDISLSSHGVSADKLRPKLGFNVKTWDNLWKEDLKGLKRRQEYAKLTKGLWAGVAPDAALAYYLPNEYKGSLAAYYESPQGERSVTENQAHSNSIVPVPGHKDNYYTSDFHSGQAAPFSTEVKRSYGNAQGTSQTNGLSPMTQGLYAGKRLVATADQASSVSQSLRAINNRLRTSIANMQRWQGREQSLASSLNKLNQQERQQLLEKEGASLLPSSSKVSQSSPRAAQGGHAGTAADTSMKQVNVAMLASAASTFSAPPSTIIRISSAGEEGASDKVREKLRRFRLLRRKFHKWKKYFGADKDMDTSSSAVRSAKARGKREAYFWCYSHYGDYEPDKLQGSFPELEECMHILGGYSWGPREGGDEAAAYGDASEPRPGISNSLKPRRGFGDGPVVALNPDAASWKYFESDEEGKEGKEGASRR